MSPQNLFSDLDRPNKEYMLLAKHMYKCFRELGAEFVEALFPKFDEIQYELIKTRWDNMIQTSKKVIEGEIPINDADKILLYTLPHVISLISSLQTGLVKLLYGESVDVTAVMVDDFNWRVVTCMNGHMEDGVPVDWWNIGLNDDLMERRHMKRGMKFKDIYKSTKNVTKAAELIIDVLKDVRNERTPQWSNSLYTIVMLHTSGLFNFFTELSSFEVIGSIWDGYNSKAKYKLQDYWFLMYPDPPMIRTMAMSGREQFIRKLTGLTTANKFALHTIEEPALNWIKEEVPEAYDAVILDDWEEGIPLPISTLQCEIPTNVKKLVTKDGRLNWKYPNHPRIKMETFDFTTDDAFDGYLTDLTADTPPDVELNRDNLISKYFGQYAEFYK
ncbi:MAG: hypothetical protein ACTSO9_05280 [Candidatus Helarchaeota archaeon]